MRGGPNHMVLGIAIVVVAGGVGFVLMGNQADRGPEARKAPSRAAVERQLRDGDVLTGPAPAPFTLRHPDDWTGVDGADLSRTRPRPVAALRRRDDSGLLTVTVQGPVEGGLGTLRRTLRARLEQRFDDVRLVAIRLVRVAAGRALYASFVREKSGQIQTMLVVPDGRRRTFQVDAAIQASAKDTAAQVGAMLRTFDVRG